MSSTDLPRTDYRVVVRAGVIRICRFCAGRHASLRKLMFGWTAGAVHVSDLVAHGNLAPNNAGPILAWDFLLPVVLFGLYALMRRARGPEVPDAMPIRPLSVDTRPRLPVR